MKKIFCFLSIIILCTACWQDSINYEEIASYQDNSVADLELEVNSNTRVLLIFPHADDEITCAGLIAHLNERGASIHLLTLTNDPSDENIQIRSDELLCSAEKLGIEKVDIPGLFCNTWEDIMNDEITFWYDNKDSVKSIISNKIKDFRPHILITYDTEIGAYGHPEHRISAQLTEDIFNESITDTAFSPQMILQFTLPDKLEEFLVGNTPGYGLSIELCQNNGLPEPDFALNIEKYWPLKNAAAQCYESQKRTLSKFFCIYEAANENDHIKAFCKEYYTFVER